MPDIEQALFQVHLGALTVWCPVHPVPGGARCHRVFRRFSRSIGVRR